MATRTMDQELVAEFSEDHGRRDEDEYGMERESKRRRRAGPEVIACFGYHPWFCHLLHLGSPDRKVSKEEHYASIFLPSEASTSYTSQKQLLDEIIPDLPEPIAIQPLIEQMRTHAVQAQIRGSLVMIGEVGLDRSFRVPFPGHKANHCGEHTEVEEHTNTPSVADAEAKIATSGEEEMAKKLNQPELISRSKNLTPFRPSMDHQIALLDMQMDLAVELGINVSLHSVKAQGPTLDFLRRFKKKHGAMFTDRVNVDVHSCGGWSVESWVDAEKHFPNLYLSPSIAISGRTPVTPYLIRAAAPSRLLVESDTHLIQDTTKRVWAATVWIAKCRGWKIERTKDDLQGEDSGVVSRLESNWNRFMNL
ncbi:hypothetical protein HD553DRAFT_53516 [Filobasidium floriforme]|uniref:uncharacterized protein n=1 Tax=Filobasidium floriforme TaxID=5210 RepID=UPI001E8D580D|nr:uncharacterized protein HD553DRAFT_53516 [Filobasidium floriforme]KAH8083077.1 hypothetical protein HD553DRAFT_53516 [Filobasidium floriforme]